MISYIFKDSKNNVLYQGAVLPSSEELIDMFTGEVLSVSKVKTVKCIDTKGYDNLTVGKVYPVVYENSQVYGVIGDYEETNYQYEKSQFVEEF